jgi:hypothetical protein
MLHGAFLSPQDGELGFGKRPVVFDILAPDFETSLLPDDLKMVMHVNPSSMKFSYAKIIERIQTKGGYVEQHFGDGAESISMDASSGAFMRLHTGLISITGGSNSLNVGGTRRETIAYDTFLDMLAMFHHNGSIFDYRGNIVFQGIIKISFDGDYWLGWFNSFSASEEAEKPYQFSMSMDFTIAHEFMGLRSVIVQSSAVNPLGGENPLAQDLEQKQENEDVNATWEERLGGFLQENVGDPLAGATRASLGWILPEDEEDG